MGGGGSMTCYANDEKQAYVDYDDSATSKMEYDYEGLLIDW